ncbi:MAG: GTP 3',8-cyclase MoaA [Aureliella sp.]
MSTSEAANKRLPTEQSATPPVLVDTFGRQHRSLRISVTDVCNIRCQYCMPAELAHFMPRDHLLSYEAIVQFAQIAIDCSINRFRITGGEPLTRPNLDTLIAQLSDLKGLNDLALTTNGILLSQQADALVAAGLKRVNISLDTLSEATFKRLSRRDGISRVIDGIDAALASELDVKLNALVLRGVNSDDILELVDFAQQRKTTIRFIEFMPLDADGAWNDDTMISGEQLRTEITQHLGPLEPVPLKSKSQPAREFKLPGGGHVGFIDSVSSPFCSSCDRLRLTADGKLRNCLFGQQEWDVSELLSKAEVDRKQVIETIRTCILAKHAAHGIAQPGFKPPQRAMYQIGG